MPAAASLKAMVVDDHRSMRFIVCEELKAIGITKIREAADGEQALKALELEPAHLILSDVNMPNMDGLELLRAVRTCDRNKGAIFILLTGVADREVVQKAVHFGVNNFLVKPFNGKQLRQKIEQVTGALT